MTSKRCYQSCIPSEYSICTIFYFIYSTVRHNLCYLAALSFAKEHVAHWNDSCVLPSVLIHVQFLPGWRKAADIVLADLRPRWVYRTDLPFVIPKGACHVFNRLCCGYNMHTWLYIVQLDIFHPVPYDKDKSDTPARPCSPLRLCDVRRAYQSPQGS